MNKREYAISLGLAKPGKGRLSLAAKTAIHNAELAGMVFTNTNTPTRRYKPTPTNINGRVPLKNAYGQYLPQPKHVFKYV